MKAAGAETPRAQVQARTQGGGLSAAGRGRRVSVHTAVDRHRTRDPAVTLLDGHTDAGALSLQLPDL